MLLVIVLIALLTTGFISDNAIHLPPDCGTYAYDSYTPATTGFPSVGGTFLDPIFGESFVRLSNIYPSTSGSAVIYGINGQWNADSTVVFHDSPAAGVSIINANTGALIRDNVPFANPGAVSFDPVDPDIYYYTTGNTIAKYSVSGNTSTTVKDFGTAVGDIGRSSDWIDRTGTYFLVYLSNSLRLWNKTTNTLYTGSVAVPQDSTGFPATGGSGWAGLSPDGNYIILALTNNTCPGVNCFSKYSYAINHAGTSVNTTGVLFWYAINSDHADIVSASDGNTYLITGQNQYSFAGQLRHYFRVNVTNDVSALGSAQLTATGNQMLIPILAGNTAGNGDFACGAKGTYQDWCYAVVADPADLLGNQGTWYAYKSELMLIHMLPPFEVRRLMHHRARPHRGFCRQVRQAANWDGTKIIFTSPFSAADSADCGYSDLYRYDAP